MTTQEVQKRNTLTWLLALLFVGSLIFSHYVYVKDRRIDKIEQSLNHQQMIDLFIAQDKSIQIANQNILQFTRQLKRMDSTRKQLDHVEQLIIKQYTSVYEKIKSTPDSMQRTLTLQLIKQHRANQLERN